MTKGSVLRSSRLLLRYLVVFSRYRIGDLRAIGEDPEVAHAAGPLLCRMA
jgi:hypothetical protein